MWLLLTRTPAPDVPYWPGRRWLAALDSVVWPLIWIAVVGSGGVPTGIVGPLVTTAAVLAGAARLHCAVYLNHRYRFTTCRWGKRIALLSLVGTLLKLAMQE